MEEDSREENSPMKAAAMTEDDQRNDEEMPSPPKEGIP